MLRTRSFLLAALMLLLTVPALAQSAQTASSPTGAAQEVLDLLLDGEFEAVRDALCSERRDEIADVVDLPRALDPDDAYAGALRDTVDVVLLAASAGELSLAEDRASVFIVMALAIDMNAIKQRRIVTAAMEGTDGEVNPWEVDAEMARIAEALPRLLFADTEVAVVRENGRWAVCGDFMGPDVRVPESPYSVEPDTDL